MSSCVLPRKIHVHRPQIKIPEIEFYQIVSSHAQISPQGAEKQLSKVRVVGGGGGGGCTGQTPILALCSARACQLSAELHVLVVGGIPATIMTVHNSG